MGSEDRAASPVQRRCGSMWSPMFSTPMAPMHRPNRRCIGLHRHRIADIFASFYEQLYKSRGTTDEDLDNEVPLENEQHHTSSPFHGRPPLGLKELRHAIRQLRNGKCPDTAGITAEMLRSGGKFLEQHLLKFYNDILRPELEPPRQWRQMTIRVIHTSGDPGLPKHDRPIAILSMLYKLLARLLCNRLGTIFDADQSSGQAGFRKGFSTENHVFTTAIIQERSNEWQLPGGDSGR
ncbi:unnamed protein product [Prorocentrum cordatum]|uniref:Reverse transcriptase domain-containing protein n=1 Tax=Prorocentrum cordatum TaxID=2364126 RepID=A0ABN9UQM9_9DINO|nr:unnamed protein product [Polarella glacialis]